MTVLDARIERVPLGPIELPRGGRLRPFMATRLTSGNDGVDPLPAALEACEGAGYSPSYTPDVAMARLALPATKDSALFNYELVTGSLRIVGHSPGGAHVDVYAHGAHPFLSADHIRGVTERREFTPGALYFPEDMFNHLLTLDGSGRVFVVDHSGTDSHFMSVDEALEHPHTLPFLGLGHDEAQAYLTKHNTVYEPIVQAARSGLRRGGSKTIINGGILLKLGEGCFTSDDRSGNPHCYHLSFSGPQNYGALEASRNNVSPGLVRLIGAQR